MQNLKLHSLTTIGIVALVFGALGFGINAEGQNRAAGDTSKIVRANQFILEDPTGKERASLRMAGQRVLLSVLNNEGNPGVVLQVDDKGAGVIVSDSNGNSVSLAALQKGKSGLLGLTMDNADAPDQTRIEMMRTDSTAVLNIGDAKSVTKISYDHGYNAISMVDANRKTSLQLSTSKDGPNISLYDEQGRPRASIGQAKTSLLDGTQINLPVSSMLLYGPDGKVLWSANH